MFNTFQSTESRGMVMAARRRKKANQNQRREAEKKQRRIEQQRRVHTIVIQLKEAQDIVGHLRIDSRKTLKHLYNFIKDNFPSPKPGFIPKIYSGKIKLSDKNIEKLTIAKYFNITEEQLEGWAAARVAGTMARQFPEQAIHMGGQSLTLLIIYKRKMPEKLRRNKRIRKFFL
jgi:hypothetical protein|tara:strand:+ start:31 stop:549 length:519 start_codon:yes stop_codon:yes gene_type:complete